MTDDPRARDTYQQEEIEMNESEAPEGQPTYPMQWTELAVTNSGDHLILEAGNGEVMVITDRVRFHPGLGDKARSELRSSLGLGGE